MMLNRVVFPAPLGPINPVIVPRRMPSEAAIHGHDPAKTLGDVIDDQRLS